MRAARLSISLWLGSWTHEGVDGVTGLNRTCHVSLSTAAWVCCVCVCIMLCVCVSVQRGGGIHLPVCPSSAADWLVCVCLPA